jgi:hypothetical protein
MKKLELNQMEILLGGQIKPKRDDDDTGGGSSSGCKSIADGLGGASLIFGAASWWTGAGAGFALGLAAVAYGVSLAC